MHTAGDQIGISGSTAFTVTVQTAVALNPSSGPAGSQSRVTGSGFSLTSKIIINFGSTQVATTISGGSGDIGVTFTVPSVSSGTYSVTAYDASGDTASATFDVTQGGATTAPTTTPATTTYPTSTPSITMGSITVVPTQARAGTTVTATGSGFTPSGLVSINMGSTPVVTTYADGSGSISATFTVPSVSSGTYTVRHMTLQQAAPPKQHFR